MIKEEPMPFKETRVQDLLESKVENNEFKIAYEKSRAEIKIIENIIKLRKSKNLTQHELAKVAHVSQQAISRLERERHLPNLSTLIRIIEGLDCELSLVNKDKASSM